MSALEVWLSTSKERPALTLSEGWERIGEVDTFNEPDAQRFWQGIWRLKAAPRGKSTKFYVMVDPATAWYSSLNPDTQQQLKNGFGTTGEAPFWLAFHWAVTPARTYYATLPSQFTTITRRPPESHPGLKTTRTAAAVKVSWGDGPYFDETQ